MKNSKVMCLPLCLPFDCYGIDSNRSPLPEEAVTHYFAELALIREGQLRVTLDREELLVSPGEAILLCPGVRHRLAPEGESVRMDLLRMDPDRLPEMPEYAPSLKAIFCEAWRDKLPMVVPAPEVQEMALPELSALCVQEATDRPYGFDLSVSARLSLICMALVRFWLAHGLRLGERDPQIDPIYSLSGYIQRHLRESLRVEDLAAYCGLSYPWFAKKFREIYGISCKDYIEQIRVAQVERFLLFTEMDLTRISEATGYADCSHMIKNFKRIMEITPGQYRLKRR
ncbi:MAG: helix-turn-helix transcriptional regulator [Clostridia bacterium]|nr:helix-turn-helix transcriptional regulator [Clostridia bacterium]